MSQVVVLGTEGASLKFEQPEQIQKFEMGVASAVFLWDDLDTAVSNGWGGPESAEKREWLVGAILELFDLPEVGTDDIEYRLLAAMEDEFDVTVETDSAYYVAQDIAMLYKQVALNNYELADQLFTRFQNRQPAKRVTVQEENDDLESGEEEFEDDHMDCDDHGHSRRRNEPEIDEDGFQIVR